MPIYEYKCKKCGEKFEMKLGIFQNKKSVKCPKCGGGEPERVFSSFSTDSRSGSCSTRSFG
jgi:putative FmdB family regulatory protein